MWFHFCFSNHSRIGRQTLADMFQWFRAGLLELGHRVTVSDEYVYEGAINVFWENFFPGSHEKLEASGITYGVVATEIPHGDSFNGRSDGSWTSRWKSFPEVAAGAAFIWTMVESTVPFYSRFAPTAFVELGFSELLIPRATEQPQDIDFSFFGLRTPYREKVLRKLQSHARVCCPDRFLSGNEVASLISRTKVGLSFKQSETWPVPSPTRLGRHLMARRGLVTESTQVVTRQARLISIVPEGEDLAEFAMQKLRTWQEDADVAFERYRTEMPMQMIVQDVLDRTRVSRLNAVGSKGLVIGLPHSEPVDIAPEVPPQPQYVESVGAVNIVRFKAMFYCAPQALGPLDLSKDENRNRPGIHAFTTLGAARDAALGELDTAALTQVTCGSD